MDFISTFECSSRYLQNLFLNTDAEFLMCFLWHVRLYQFVKFIMIWGIVIIFSHMLIKLVSFYNEYTYTDAVCLLDLLPHLGIWSLYTSREKIIWKRNRMLPVREKTIFGIIITFRCNILCSYEIQILVLSLFKQGDEIFRQNIKVVKINNNQISFKSPLYGLNIVRYSCFYNLRKWLDLTKNNDM